MSDTANPANLASADEFDARLKRTDEDRWLASRYAAVPARELLVAVYLLNQDLQRTLQTKEPMLGKIRLQWWRETIEQIAGPGPVRRHDLAEELARVTKARADLIAPINALIDAFDDILDDHMQAGGHQAAEEHEKRHLAAEAALMRLAGLSLEKGANETELAILTTLGEARVAVLAGLPDAEKRWDAGRKASKKLRPQLWPAVLHMAPGPDDSPIARRWRIFVAAASRKLRSLRTIRESDL
jgi:hypothetical protein